MATVFALIVAAAVVVVLVAREAAHRREVSRLKELLGKAHTASSRSEELANVGAIVSDLAQELKAPLQGVLGNTELMLMSGPGAQDAEGLHDIRQNATRAAGIVRNLLAFTDTTNLKRNWYDVNTIVSRAAETCRTEAEPGRFEIEFAPAARLPLLYVDSRQIEKVLTTFIGRGTKAGADGAGQAAVRVMVSTGRTTQPDDRLLIDIEDAGAAVPMWDESIGDGGLATCTRIVEAHGGSVTVEDRPRGLHVHLEFPITAGSAARARLESSRE